RLPGLASFIKQLLHVARNHKHYDAAQDVQRHSISYVLHTYLLPITLPIQAGEGPFEAYLTIA
ncbi:hypothetical protein, partial [Bilophila wadsworthia]|uniref:hypothetical protein n=1 Tax=Bilophila wadsworthia TaxID=35833 RepID=UPI0032BFFB8A